MKPPNIAELRGQIDSCENKLKSLRHQLAEAEELLRQQNALLGLHSLKVYEGPSTTSEHISEEAPGGSRRGNENINSITKRNSTKWPLEKHEYRRYGRQLIMPEIGLQGQLALKKARVLIVGVGGLGCPAALYLAGAGVGTIGLMDGDIVEESNLHRQVLHSTSRIGMTKVESAIVALKEYVSMTPLLFSHILLWEVANTETSLNPNAKLLSYTERLTAQSSISIFGDYDIVLDCTDTPASRYLISDTCILSGKPLISASALRNDGQLMVLNAPVRPPGDTDGGPCYRCVFPRPPPPELVVSCGDGGILGPVVGVMGTLQALEAIKTLARQASTVLQTKTADPPRLLIFSAFSNPMFRTIRLRARKANCIACSSQATISRESLRSGSLDYIQFCGSISPISILTPQERISAKEYSELKSEAAGTSEPASQNQSHVLIDVRERVQFELCNIEGSINIPFSAISRTSTISSANNITASYQYLTTENTWFDNLKDTDNPIYVVCRLGNDSQVVVKKMKDVGLDHGGKRNIMDIRGGLQAWRRNVDVTFPDY